MDKKIPIRFIDGIIATTLIGELTSGSFGEHKQPLISLPDYQAVTVSFAAGDHIPERTPDYIYLKENSGVYVSGTGSGIGISDFPR